MKSLSLRLAAAVLAFIVGVSVFWLWSSWQAGTCLSWGSPQTLPYCEVVRNGEYYHNRIIRVRATLIRGAYSTYISEDCDPVEASMAGVEMNDATITDKGHELDRFLDAPDSAHKKFNVIIEGRFDAKFSMGCFGPKYHIAATKVELLTPTTNYFPPLHDEEWACG